LASSRVVKRINSQNDRYEFIQSYHPFDYDYLLRECRISDANVEDNEGRFALLWIQQDYFFRNNKNKDIAEILLSYLLTCDTPADINKITKFRYTALWVAMEFNNHSAIKLLINFDADREITKSIWNTKFSPLKYATSYRLIDKHIDRTDSIKVLKEYLPSEEEKLTCQLECKRRVDLTFQVEGKIRFKQAEIDLKYNSLEICLNAVKNGDLESFKQSITYVDARMANSLTLIAIDREQQQLLPYLLEKLVHENVFDVRDNTIIKPFLYSGFNCWHHIPKLYPDTIKIINHSRVLCIFKILYYKFIFLSIESIFELVQILIHELLFDVEEK
jgi:hypothetical protein